MSESDAQIFKTLIHYLIASNHTEAAAAIIDGEIVCDHDRDDYGWYISKSAFPRPLTLWWHQATSCRASFAGDCEKS